MSDPGCASPAGVGGHLAQGHRCSSLTDEHCAARSSMNTRAAKTPQGACTCLAQQQHTELRRLDCELCGRRPRSEHSGQMQLSLKQERRFRRGVKVSHAHPARHRPRPPEFIGIILRRSFTNESPGLQVRCGLLGCNLLDRTTEVLMFHVYDSVVLKQLWGALVPPRRHWHRGWRPFRRWGLPRFCVCSRANGLCQHTTGPPPNPLLALLLAREVNGDLLELLAPAENSLWGPIAS